MFVESVRAKLDEIFSKAESKGDTFIFDNEFLDLTEMLRDHIEKQSFKLYRFSKADYDNIRNFETGTLYQSRRGRFCLTLVPSPKGNVVNFEHNPNRSRAKGIPKPSPDGEGGTAKP